MDSLCWKRVRKESRHRTCYHCSRGTDGSDRDAVKWQRPGASQGGKRSHDSISANGRGYGFIRTQDYIHTDLSWNVTGLLKDMRSKGTKIYFDFSKRYRHEDVPTILKNINYGIFSFEEETEEVRELLRMGCSMGAEVLLATFGEGGSLAFDGTEFYRQPCIPAPKLVNTVGAGDSYGAGFMSGVLRGRSIPECMLSGAKKAAEIVSIFEPYHV